MEGEKERNKGERLTLGYENMLARVEASPAELIGVTGGRLLELGRVMASTPC